MGFCPLLLSIGQKEWFYKNKHFFKKHKQHLYYVISDTDNTICEAKEYGINQNVLNSLLIKLWNMKGEKNEKFI